MLTGICHCFVRDRPGEINSILVNGKSKLRFIYERISAAVESFTKFIQTVNMTPSEGVLIFVLDEIFAKSRLLFQ